jgi:signal transduction histidine kinase/ligand-binding sensor domain-containing protein
MRRSQLAGAYRAFIIATVAVSLWLPAFPAQQLWGASPYLPVLQDPVLESWRWQAFPRLKGLGLRCLVESLDGSVWFGTDEGVVRFDGLHWTSFGHAQNLTTGPVNVLCASRDGSVYAGCEKGVYQFRAGAWANILPNEDTPFPVDDISESADGSIWVASPWGALRIGKDDLVLYTTRSQVAMVEDLFPAITCTAVPDGATPERQWTVGERFGIGIRLAEGDWLGTSRGSCPVPVSEVADGGPGDRAGLEVGDRILTVNRRRPTLWNDALYGERNSSIALRVARRGSGETQDLEIQRLPVKGTYSDFAVVDVLEDQRGRMWFGLGGSPGGEVICWDAQSHDTADPEGWRLYNQRDGLDTAYGSHLTQTRDGSVWLFSNPASASLSRYDGTGWTGIDLAALGGANTNTSVAQTGDGTVWVGGASLHALRGSSWTVYGPSTLVLTPSLRTRLLASADGSLWVAGLGQEAVRCDIGSRYWTTYLGLSYQCEDSSGRQWFVSDDSTVVCRDGGTWTRFGIADGLMDLPRELIVAQDGTLWAAGSHAGVAATAQSNGSGWEFETHPGLSRGLRPEIYGSPDGDVWLAAGGGFNRNLGQQAGVLQYTEGGWQHHVPPEAPMFTYGITRTTDGTTWFCGRELHSLTGGEWDTIPIPEPLASDWCEAIAASPDGKLWVGTRSYGIFMLHDGRWSSFDVRTGLADNRVQSIAIDPDGSVWAATPKGISRFDGAKWTTMAFPAEFDYQEHPDLRISQNGDIWVSYPHAQSKVAIRYRREAVPPETEVTLYPERASELHQTTFSWKGTDWWESTPTQELQYTWRRDGNDWSSYSSSTSITLTSVPSGNHSFEVKARDRDFNEDPTPAVVHFTVLPPVWGQSWFQALILVLLSAIAVQTIRVVRRGRRLRVANTALSESNKSLFRLNLDLQERSTELQQVNTQLEDLDRLKTDFFSMVSHDLRTPMTAVKGYIDNMLDGVVGELNNRQTRYLERMRVSTDRLTRMISDLLDLSRLERGAVESLDLRPARIDVLDTVREAVDGLRPIAESNRLSLRLEGVSVDVFADRDRVQQVATNLVGNAMKFTEAGGEIHLSVASGPNGFALITVRDTGIGIMPNDLEKIFDLFFRVQGQVTQEPGSGLGLAISRRLVELMGGEITAQSEVGVGSTFTFTLPEAASKA